MLRPLFTCFGLALLAACGDSGSTTTSTGGGTTSASTAEAATSSSSTGGMGGNGGSGGAPFVAPEFGAPVTLSDPAWNSFVPVVAAHAGNAIVVWHEFPPASSARIAFSIVDGTTPGPATPLAETFTNARQPSVAATTSGYVVTYVANDGTADVIRAVHLAQDGSIVDGPVTISLPGMGAAMAHVATAGDEEVFAWTDGTAHWFARRGALESVAASPVGTTLLSTGILNFPRVALEPDGTILLAYRDGADTQQWEVLLLTRPPGGAFGPPVNVSKTPGLLSDDIDLALEQDGTLDIAWVDQDAINVNAFEVDYATRAMDGTLTPPTRYGNQGLWTWKPAVVRGLAAAWYTGTINGPMFLGAPSLPPAPILPTEIASSVAMALSPEGTYHLVFTNKSATTSVVKYSAGVVP